MPSSQPLPMQQGITYRFINPEGSVSNRCPKDRLWKKTSIHAQDGKKFPFYTQRWLPHSTNINGNQRDYYYRRGWVPESQLPPGWRETNKKFHEYVKECAGRVDPNTAAMASMSQWLEVLATTSKSELESMVRREIETRMANAEEAADQSEAGVGKIKISKSK